MKLKLICEQIDNLEKSILMFKQNHPKSKFIPRFEKQIRDLFSGIIDEIPRNKFNVPIGKQYGLEFIDSLVKNKIFDLKKIGNKFYIVNKKSKSNIESKLKKLSNCDLSLILRGISLGQIELGENNKKLNTKLTNNELVFSFLFFDNGGRFYESSKQKSETKFINHISNIHPKIINMFNDKNSPYIKTVIFSIGDHWDSKGALDIKNFFELYYELKEQDIIDLNSVEFSELKTTWEPYYGGSAWDRPFRAQIKCEINFKINK